ncbi:phage portal protein [Sinorhizobium meliloti]|uniref:phage portal protein n=1 Tax=Rhizobium meliloti TaxID=382 RepID=UPI00238013AF|nr:phage portal protein [Sinorhizobium meliloti]MDE3797607.1 phage portal protein [Sinorhizobium meliloti]
MGFLVKAIAAPFKLYQSIADEVAKERRLPLSDGKAWAALFGRESYSGKIVTMDSAMQLATVWACIKVTAQAVSCLPLHMYEKRDGDDHVRVDGGDIGEVLTDSPNQDQTPLEFWESMVAWLVTQGNAYAEKVSTGRRLSALQPLASTQCMPVRQTDGTLIYRFNDRGKAEDLPRDKVFHLKGFGQGIKDPDLGLSPIAYGVNSLGSAMSAEEAAGKMFGNGMQASGVLSSDQILKQPQREQLQKIMAAYSGSSKAGKLMILEAGLKYQQLSLNPDDAQMLETRRFSVEEMCRWWGTPPIIIGHASEGQTMWGSGVEQIMLSWLTLGIDPICDRIEARIKKQLVRPTGNRRLFAEFNREALLQMDSTAKANFLSSMVQNGLMDRNEGRAKLNLSNRDGADQLTAQTNLAPLDRLGAAQDGNSARAALRAWLGLETEGKRNERS